jgi:hypothetical protein
MFEDRFLIVPSISVHPDELYIYGRKEWIKEPDYPKKKSLLNLLNNNHHNKLSEKAKQKAKRAIKYLIYQSSQKTAYNYKTQSRFTFRVCFITLTLSSSQKHTDKEIKNKLLNQFLIEAKKKWGIEHYVWKSERQKNGNIHFHILTDRFIPWLELRNTWNRIQNKLGYVDEFEKVHHKKSPNSSDIHSLKEIKNVSNYMVKYMVKNENKNRYKVHSTEVPKISNLGKQKLSLSNGAKKFLSKMSNNGRIWTASTNLSNLTGARTELNQEIEEELNNLSKEQNVKRINKEYFSGIFYSNKTITKEKYPHLYNLLNTYLSELFPKQQKEIWNDE